MKKISKLHEEDFQKRTRRFSEKILMNSGQQKQPPNKLSGGTSGSPIKQVVLKEKLWVFIWV